MLIKMCYGFYLFNYLSPFYISYETSFSMHQIFIFSYLKHSIDNITEIIDLIVHLG